MRIITSQLSGNCQSADGAQLVFNMLSSSVCAELCVHQVHVQRWMPPMSILPQNGCLQ